MVLYDLPCLAGVALVTVPAQTPRRGDYKKTRKMAVGRYKDGNRVGAMAIGIAAEQGGVTASFFNDWPSAWWECSTPLQLVRSLLVA